MSNSLSAFISELIRDANQIDLLGDFEKRRMLERAIITIRDAREVIGLQPSSVVRDPITDLQITSDLISRGFADDSKVRRAMLEAADVLRTLKIALEAVGEVMRL